MEINDTLKIQINQYLNGELSGVALSEFETQLAQNETLSNQVKAYQELDDLMIASAESEKDYDQMADLLNNLGDQYILPKNIEATTKPSQANNQTLTNTSRPAKFNTSTDRQPKSIIRYLIPLATVAAAAILLFPILFPGDADLKNLADNNYETYNISFTTKGETTNLSTAEQWYNKQEWEKAIAIFNKYPTNAKAQIAKGNCEYQLKQYNKAIATLSPIIDDGDYGASASWYLALTYLKKENQAAAIKHLNKAKVEKRFESKVNKLLIQLK